MCECAWVCVCYVYVNAKCAYVLSHPVCAMCRASAYINALAPSNITFKLDTTIHEQPIAAQTPCMYFSCIIWWRRAKLSSL